MPVRTFGICVVDGQRFEIKPENTHKIGTKHEPIYCSPRCRRIASQQRQAARSDQPCPCCGRPYVRVPSYRSGLCATCSSVAWLACWKKVQRWDRDPGTIAMPDGHPLTGYACAICDGWHATSRTTQPDREWTEAVRRVGAYLKKINFDSAAKAAQWREKAK